MDINLIRGLFMRAEWEYVRFTTRIGTLSTPRVPASATSSKDAASVVDLTFASVRRRVLNANVKSKTTLESDICQRPFGSDIRKRTRHDMIRMSEPGHWRP